MYAKRLNKVYPISSAQEKRDYLARGYDICNDDGEIIVHNPQKTVPYGQYEELRRKYEALRVELEHPDLSGDPDMSKTEEGAMGIFDADGGDIPVIPQDETPDEVKTLRHAEEPAPKMGTGKKK